jgi:phosphoglycerol transferase MdoB-like AlkP superfamily enzyme
MTHDEQFDFMNGFMKKNGFDEVIGQNHYPSKEVIGVTGVPDHVMFDLSLPYINKTQTPFFVTYLTGSDHQPYRFPKNTSFTSAQTNEHDKIVVYADWSLRYFFQKCKQQSWYNNTLFILVADHGAIVDQDEDMYMAFHHIPLLFYSPDSTIVIPREDNKLSSQL